MLKYEKFLNDYDYIFDEFESFFQIKISSELRNSLTEKYKIENVEKKFKGGSFAEFDKKTQLHGNHISKFKGASGYYKTFFSSEQIDYLSKMYFEVIKALGYES
jgi:hypothetical protein